MTHQCFCQTLIHTQNSSNSTKQSQISLTIDDWWHGQNNPIAVINDRITWLVFNQVQIVPKVAVSLEKQSTA